MEEIVPTLTSFCLNLKVERHCVTGLPGNGDGLSPQERPRVMEMNLVRISETEAYARLSTEKSSSIAGRIDAMSRISVG